MNNNRNYIISLYSLFSFILFINNLCAQNTEWTTPISLSGMRQRAGNFAPRFTLNREGKLYAIWSERDQLDNDNKARLYLVSLNNDTLTQPTPITDSGKADWTPDIAADTLGNPHVVWGEMFSGDVYYKYWQGAKWSEPINLSQNIGGSFYPCIKIDRKNRVHIAWHDNADGDYKIYYRVYDGIQWSSIIVVSDSLQYTGFPALELDSKDNIHFSWSSRMPPGDNRDIFYRAYIDEHWTNISRLTTDTLYSVYPSIAINKNDLPIIVWQQTIRVWITPIIEKIYWSSYNGINWSYPEAISDTSASGSPSVAVDSSNNFHSAWFIYGGGILYSSYLENHWTSPIPISQINGAAPQIICDKNNNLHMIWLNPGMLDQIFYSKGTIIDGVYEEQFIISEKTFKLAQNYPNPFNEQTNIEYEIKNTGFIKLEIFNILGERVNTLINKYMPAGKYTAHFDASVLGGLASGIYLYRLSTEDGTTQKSMILLR